MSRFLATLDTCVLVPSRLRDTLLDASAAGLYECHWSDDTFDELQRTLAEKTGQPDKIARLLAAMNEQFPAAAVQRREYQHLIKGLTNHPKDRHVLAAAIVSHSTVIVTDNLRDFRPDALAPHAVLAQTADAFLVQLFYQSPARILTLLHDQAAAYYRRPMTFDGLLDVLRKSVPTFADLAASADPLTSRRQ